MTRSPGLQFWRICGYQNGGRDEVGMAVSERRLNKIFGKFESAGYFGFCLTSISSYEGRRIRHWCKLRGMARQDFYWSRESLFEAYDNIIGLYLDNSRCVWVVPHLAEEFRLLLASLPERCHVVPIVDTLDPAIHRLLRGLNHRLVHGLKYDLERSHRAMLSVQDFPRIDHLMVLAAISR